MSTTLSTQRSSLAELGNIVEAFPAPPKPSLPSELLQDRPLRGLATWATRAFRGEDLRPFAEALLERIEANPSDASAMLDVSIVLQLCGHYVEGMAFQAEALSLTPAFQLPTSIAPAAVRLLAIVTPGDLTENNALEFLVEESDIALELLYTDEFGNLPSAIPDHDVAMVAICESNGNREKLLRLERLLENWTKPILNRPMRIARTARDGVCSILTSQPGLHVPTTIRVSRDALREGTLDFPLIVRPVDSHKGKGLARIGDPSDLSTYLGTQEEQEFYVAPFIDYRSPDGQFRKYRVLFIGGRPFLCHLAVSDNWIVHYMNAGMKTSSQKRDEEAYEMANFDDGFAKRHQAALASIVSCLELEYVGIDCGETAAGELLVFECDSGMTVHAMDPVDLFPYKQPQMRRVFHAFRELVAATAKSAPAVALLSADSARS